MNGDRGIAPVIGAITLFAISVALISVTAAGVSSVAASSTDAAAVHGEGRYVLDLSTGGTTAVEVRPQVVQTRDSTFHLSVEGTEAYQWDGTSAVTVACVSPGDSVSIHTTKRGTRKHFQSWTVTEETDCGLSASQRDDHAVVEGTTVSLAD